MGWTAEATVTTGQVATAAMWNLYVRDDINYLYRIPVRKSVDELVTSSAVLQNDDVLLFPVAANEVFTFRFDLLVSDNDGGFQNSVTAPSGATIDYSMVGIPGFVTIVAASTALNGIPSASGVHTVPVTIVGSISTGANAGNVQLQWAQAASSGNATKVLRGSSLIAHRIS